MEKQIVLNSMMTPDGTILTSRHLHDYVSHVDANGDFYSNDGGNDYLHRTINKVPATDLTLYSDSPFEIIREHIVRGGRGKDGNEPLKYIVLKDINDEWLQAIIDYEEELRPNNPQLEYYKQEQLYRNEQSRVQ